MHIFDILSANIERELNKKFVNKPKTFKYLFSNVLLKRSKINVYIFGLFTKLCNNIFVFSRDNKT